MRAFHSLSECAIMVISALPIEAILLAQRRITLKNVVKSTLTKPARDHRFRVRHVPAH
jgi:hypothetical protein